MIKLPEATIHLVTSTQVITSIFSAVKELVENSIDAHADNIEIRLEDFGLKKIEVADNGHGIPSGEEEFVAREHYTSKLKDIDDLSKLKSLGFRGEAVHSLCCISNLSFSTKTKSEAVGNLYRLDKNGKIISSKLCTRELGTTLISENIFQSLPVRRQLYKCQKKGKEELRKIEDLLIAYGLIMPEIRLILKHNKSVIWQKAKCKGLKDSFISLFGVHCSNQMEICVGMDERRSYEITLMLPKKDASDVICRTANDRMFMFVNQRPVHIQQLSQVLKYHCCEQVKNLGSKYPIAVLILNLPGSKVDVNIEPNKTKVLLDDMDKILELTEKTISEFYGSKNIDHGGGSDFGPANVEESSFEAVNDNNTSVALFSQEALPLAKSTQEQPCARADVGVNLASHHECVDSSLLLETTNVSKTSTPGTSNNCGTPGSSSITSDISNLSARFFEANTDVCTPNREDLFHTLNKSNGLEDCDNHRITEENINSMSSRDTKDDNANFLQKALCAGQPNTIPDNLNHATLSSKLKNESFVIASQSHGTSTHVERNSLDRDKIDKIIEFDEKGNATKIQNVTNIEVADDKNIANPERKCTEKSGDCLDDLDLDFADDTGLDFDDDGDLLFEDDSTKITSKKMKACQLSQMTLDSWSKGQAITDAVTGEPLQPVSILHSGISRTSFGGISNYSLDQTKTGGSKRRKDGIKNPHKLSPKEHNSTIPSYCNKHHLPEMCVRFSLRALRGYFSNNENEIATQQTSKLSLQIQIIGKVNVLKNWIVKFEKKIFILDSSRLQEMHTYEELMKNHRMSMERLEEAIMLTPSVIGGMENLNALENLQYENKPAETGNFVTDPRITSNGFRIRHRKDIDTQDYIYEVTHMTSVVPLYDISDLREIIVKIANNNRKMFRHHQTDELHLEEYRPRKLQEYFKREVSRLSAKSTSSFSREDIIEILERSLGVCKPNEAVCPHGKKLFHLLK